MSNYFILMYLKKKIFFFLFKHLKQNHSEAGTWIPVGVGSEWFALNDAETLSPAGCGV